MTQAVSLAQMGNGPAFSAYQSSGQSLSASTWAKLLFQTKEFDTNTCFDTTVSRFTPTTPGYYQFNGRFEIASTATSLYVAVYKNGSNYKYATANTNQAGINVSALVYLNGATDYVELYGLSGVAQNTQQGQVNTWFQGFLARGA